MTNAHKLTALGAAVAVVCALALLALWREQLRDRLAAEATVKAQQSIIDDSREAIVDRDHRLIAVEATAAKLQRDDTTPRQIVRDLPRVITLPTPITLGDSPSQTTPASSTPRWIEPTPETTGSADPAPPAATIPAVDLKPLFDHLAQCQAQGQELSVCRADLADQAKALKATTTQRNAAMAAVKGGSFLARAGRAAKWITFGIAIGTIAGKAMK